MFEAEGSEVKRVVPPAPNMNATAERWAQSLRRKCLDQFLILGEKHLAHLVSSYVEHSNLERPHQSRGNVPLPEAVAIDAGEPPILTFSAGEVRYSGLLTHDYRAAV